MNSLYAVMGGVALLATGFTVLFRIMASRLNTSASPGDWLANFSLASYAPMERLFDERDFEFLASQPGYDARIARRLRAERKEVYKGYLRRLLRDFNQLSAIAKLMIVYGSEDQRELAGSLWRQQMTFYFAICMLRCRLALYPAVMGSWDAGELVSALQRMRDNLNFFAPAHQTAIG